MDLLTELVETSGRTPADMLGIGPLLRQAIPVNIQNVAAYLYNENSSEIWDFHSDFPNIAPAWPVAFMKWRMPTVFNSEGHLVRTPMGGLDVGVLLNAGDLTKGCRGFTTDSPRPPSDARWAMSAMAFIRGVRVVHYVIGFWVTASGEFRSVGQETADHYGFVAGKPILWPEGTVIGENSDGDHTILYAPLLALSFAHCKNVKVEKRPIPAKVLRKRQRKHDWTPDAWHELRIEPMQAELKRAGAEQTGIQHALHICRGHFKDYREGRGLFGKYHGLYWWDFRLTDSSHPHQYSVGAS